MAVGAENKPKPPGSRRGEGTGGSGPQTGATTTPDGKVDVTQYGLVGAENRGMVYGPKPAGGGMYFTSGTIAEDVAATMNPWGPAYNVWQSKADLAGAFDGLEDWEQEIFARLASARGKTATASGTFDRYVSRAAALSKEGQRKTPVEIAYEDAMKKGLLGADYEPPSKEAAKARGRYAGPTASVSVANEDDLRRTADALGAELLGRAVSDEEFQKVLKRVRSAEQAQPTVTSRAPGATVTETGISAEGRKDIMRDMLAQDPESQEFLKATKFMGMFNEWLDRRAG